MNNIISANIHCLLILVLFSCQAAYKIDLDAEKRAILELHSKQRDYHFEKDSISFANQLSDNFISVNNGIISQPDRQATISRYHSYFSFVDFEKWDDVTDPIIEISRDGTLAYTIVDKEVIIEYLDEQNNQKKEKTHFSWLTVYKKYGVEWKIECVTSTNEPSELLPL